MGLDLMDNLVKPIATPVISQDRPERVILVMGLLVLLLHAVVYKLINQPEQAVKAHTKIIPFKLEMAILPSPETPASKSANITESKPKAKEKPLPPKKKPPAKRKPEDFSAIQQLIHSQQPIQVTRSVKSRPNSRVVHSVSSFMFHSRPKTPNAIDNFPESDEHNPSPEYPEMAIFLGYQGTSIVKINITAKGLTKSVEVLRSSSHKMLDESTTKALRKWRFTATNHADFVIIVVNYILR